MQVLITGANRGIGLALHDHYAGRGWRTLGTARSPKDGQLPLDVTDPHSIQALAARVPGPLDLLICNAGIYPDRGQTLDTGFPAAIWASGFATNVTGVFLTVQALLPQLRAARGRVAILSSRMGSTALAPGGSYLYRASKAAVLNLGRNLAADLRRDGIAVGIFHPGWVKTDMGGAGAPVSADASATGLAARIDALTLDRTGCFESFDGEALPF